MDRDATIPAADDARPTPTATTGHGAVARALGKVRLVAVLGVAGLAVTSVVTFGWAIAKTVKLTVDLLDAGWRDSASIVGLLEVIDLFLLGTVQLIVVIGLYELFVGDLDVPEWLTVRSLADLKVAITEVLVLVIAIKFLEKLVTADDAEKLLAAGVASALVGGMLIAFIALRPSSH